MKHTSESGRSLLEMLGVIGVISVLSVGAITASSFAGRYYRTTQFHVEVEDIATRILDLYSWSKTFNGLTTVIACNNDVFEKCENNAGVSPWGGRITVAPADDNKGFTITYSNVDSFTCNQIKAHIGQYETVSLRSILTCNGDEDVTFGY